MSLPVATVWDASSGALAWVAYAACTLALLPAGARWLRVAQREHYLAGSATRFALRWWASEPGNIALAFVGVAGLALSFAWPLAALAAAAVAAVGPWRLSVRGRTSPLVWTRRLRTLAAFWGLAEVVVLVAGVLAGLPAPFAAAAALLAPVLVDLACALAAPLERRLAAPFVERAQQRLARVAPTIIGITGSYGKTSTKNHVAYLVAGTKAVVATPRSYNNMAGLARSVNEQLAEGTEVFVAEMGTYGPGEIAAMCAWCPPEIAVLTTIGPVHLERMGSLDKILENKAEITESASTVVLNVDDERLARLAERLAPTVRVLRCSAVDAGADVAVLGAPGPATVVVNGRMVAAGIELASGVQPTNLACAIAVGTVLGVPDEAIAARLRTMEPVANRQNVVVAPSGILVIDDTFNANPAGAAAALVALAAADATRRRVVVTPGMVELGREQARANAAFATAATGVATDLVVVGRTNRRALLRGGAALAPITVNNRHEAVQWVRTHLGIGDAVLYENDLPDHYP
jgi:UDP-N-acetylmuramoyl-tripeptide--D-alanyl-D-alanine ligase